MPKVLRHAAAVVLLVPALVSAQAERAGRWSAGFERVELPAGERLGLAGVSYVVETAPGWWLGPALFGAATGERGGLFTWGVEAQRHWRPADGWRVVAGLYAGGGGGASAPVGGGLMLRPHLDLLHDFGGWSLGLTLSDVRFPSGDIASRQAGVVLAVDDTFQPAGRSALRVDRLAFTVGQFRRANDPALPAESAGYLSLRSEHALSAHTAFTLEAGAAAQGSADGYAEFLAGAVGRWPLGPFDLGVRAALGLGGGGAVPTGGGPVAKGALLARWRVLPGWWLEAEAGQQRALDGGWRTPYAGLTLGAECCGAPAATDVGTALQVYTGAQRRDGSTRALTALGLTVRRSLGDTLYATGQAWGAVDGGAGAYSVGLLGLGAAWPLDRAGRWRASIEALAGAAGGGGVSSSGGAVVQPMAWADTALSPTVRLRVGAGAIRSVKGELSTPVAELGLSVALGPR